MSEIKPCPEVTQAEIKAGVAVMWRYAIDDIVRVQTPDHVLARLHTEYCDVFRSAYTAAMAVRTFRDRASDACASVQKERDALIEVLADIAKVCEDRIQDGIEMGASVWRIALVDISTEIRAFLARYEGERK